MRTRADAGRRSAAWQAFTRAVHSIERFALTPATALPIAVLRIGLASVLLAQAVLVAPALFELYGPAGILQGRLRDAFTKTGLPRMGWWMDLLAPLGVGEHAVIAGTGVLYVLSLVALLLGWHTRAAAAAAWLTHLMLTVTVDAMSYGADTFAHIFLFYLIWMPAGAALSLDHSRDRRRGRGPAGPSPAARLSLRVLQLHLCIIYLSSGLAKASGAAWWNGEAIWRSLMLPEYRQLDFSWLSRHAWLAATLGWAVLVVEIGYAFLIWPRLTRRLWVAATVALHLGIAVFMGLWVFGAIMPVFTIAAFGVDPDLRSPPIRGGRSP